MSEPRGKAKRGHIPWPVKAEIYARPCAVCGVPFDIRVDHVIPVARGGSSEPANLQPLCNDCNCMKSDRHSNESLALIIAGRGHQHFVRAVYREAMRYRDPYEGPGFDQWCRRNHDRIAYAVSLYIAFLGRRA